MEHTKLHNIPGILVSLDFKFIIQDANKFGYMESKKSHIVWKSHNNQVTRNVTTSLFQPQR